MLSRYESWSLVTSEAIAHNTPVVLSDSVRIADVLPKAEYVSVFGYGNIECFANAIENL